MNSRVVQIIRDISLAIFIVSLVFVGIRSLSSHHTPVKKVAASGLQIPAGSVLGYGGSTAPEGWLIADGSAVSRDAYSELFNVVGVTYGVGDGSTTFNLPDMRGRVAVGSGQGSGLTNRLLGESGGLEYTNGITADKQIGQIIAPSPDAIISRTSGGLRPYVAGTADTSFAGDLADSNMSPFIVLNYIISIEPTSDIPVGAVVASSSSSVPYGWLEADGSAISRSTYSLLYTKYGVLFGSGDGSTTFNLPDLRGRMVVGNGSGPSLTSRNLADTGGLEYTTGIPAVSQIGTDVRPDSTLTFGIESNGYPLYYTGEADTTVLGPSEDSNMQPYIATKYLVQTGPGVLPAGAVISYAGINTPSLWNIADGTEGTIDSRGRMLIGSGQGTGLTDRNIGSTGGLQYTTGIPVSTEDPDTDTPSPSNVVGDPLPTGSRRLYRVDNDNDVSLYGDVEDSNMSPYLVLNMIQNGSGSLLFPPDNIDPLRSDDLDIDVSFVGQSGDREISFYEGSFKAFESSVNFDQSRNWSDSIIDLEGGRSFVSLSGDNLGDLGGSSQYALVDSSNSILRFCVSATSLSEVYETCPYYFQLLNGSVYNYNGSDISVTQVEIGGTSYWKVVGYIGGIVSMPYVVDMESDAVEIELDDEAIELIEPSEDEVIDVIDTDTDIGDELEESVEEESSEDGDREGAWGRFGFLTEAKTYYYLFGASSLIFLILFFLRRRREDPKSR